MGIHALCDELLRHIVSYCDGLDAVHLHASSRALRWERPPVMDASEESYNRYCRMTSIFGRCFVQKFRWAHILVAVKETPWCPDFSSPTGYIDRVRHVSHRPILWGSDPEGRAFLALCTNYGTFSVFQRFEHTKRTWTIGENIMSAFRTSRYWMEEGLVQEPRVPHLIEALLNSYRNLVGPNLPRPEHLELRLTNC